MASQGNAAPLEQARFKLLLQPSLDAYAAGTIDSQQLDARRADARKASTRRPPRPTRQMSCVVMVRPTVDRVRSCWNYRFVQERWSLRPALAPAPAPAPAPATATATATGTVTASDPDPDPGPGPGSTQASSPVQEDLQMVPEADASGQRRALNNVTRWKARVR